MSTNPPPEVIALNRLGYGPRPGDVERVRALGLRTYVEQQLFPAEIDDGECEGLLAETQLLISYPADPEGRYDGVYELRPLDALANSTAELWPLTDFAVPMHWEERVRPFKEVLVATWVRAVHSRRQLLELLTEFWHDHFAVNAAGDPRIAAALPAYDRDVIRPHALGNFRALLEAVASSTAMIFFLNNASNRAGGGEGGNENFARELLELHTLGAQNYLRFYDDRRRIGVNAEGQARGYIDDDVYEAARAFTGWTADSATGAFRYEPSWHDTSPKTVLSPDGFPNIPRNQPELKDGRDVLDLLAAHRGTAEHLCAKLCRRLLADDPPRGLVRDAADVWMRAGRAPDQLAQVVRTILLSAEFRTTWGRKVKRPFELAASLMRATGAGLPRDTLDPRGYGVGQWDTLYLLMHETGHARFECRTPAGTPDEAAAWISTSGMLARWNLPYALTAELAGVAPALWAQTRAALPDGSCGQIVDFWLDRLYGYGADEAFRQRMVALLAQGGDPGRPPAPTAGPPDHGDAAALNDRLGTLVQLLAAAPAFQRR